MSTVPPYGGTGSTMIPLVRDETRMEYISDYVLGVAFVLVGIAAAQR